MFSKLNFALSVMLPSSPIVPFAVTSVLEFSPRYGVGRRYLTGEIQMCINVACCADVTVTQPLLNLLQAHAIGIEQTGTTMAQIVKADTLHLVCYQKIWEMLTQKVGPNPLSHRVYIDIVKIIGAIAFAADLPILLLLLFHFIEHLLTGRD